MFSLILLTEVVDTSGKRGKPYKKAKDQENMVDESNEGAEKYELRERKKVKTD